MEPTNIPHKISMVRTLIRQHFSDELQKAGLPELDPSLGEILYILKDDEAKTISDIIRTSMRDKSTVTVQVNKLLALGLVEKSQCSRDRRRAWLRLSEKGRRFMPEMKVISLKISRKIFENFTETEAGSFSESLDKIIKNFAV
jgi:DNA-binding MarR family transcriptional regulator